jgi:hypothetical protein
MQEKERKKSMDEGNGYECKKVKAGRKGENARKRKK